MGPSGAGKSTLLHVIGMHDASWTGEYWLPGEPVHKMSKASGRNCRSAISALFSRAIICWMT